MTDAVVYVPEDLDADDALLARRGIFHVERHRNRLVGVLRDAAEVLRLAGEGVMPVVARWSHAAPLREAGVQYEVVGDDTCRLVPIIHQVVPGPRPNGRVYGNAAPFDESPTVAILDRWRVLNCPSDGGFAERFLKMRNAARDT